MSIFQVDVPEEQMTSEEEKTLHDDSLLHDELYNALFKVSGGHLEVLDESARKSAKAAAV